MGDDARAAPAGAGNGFCKGTSGDGRGEEGVEGDPKGPSTVGHCPGSSTAGASAAPDMAGTLSGSSTVVAGAVSKARPGASPPVPPPGAPAVIPSRRLAPRFFLFFEGGRVLLVGIWILAPQYGQIPFLPAWNSLTFSLCPCGQ
jgi:hypothetical protein